MAHMLIPKGNPNYYSAASVAHFSDFILAKEATSLPEETTARDSQGRENDIQGMDY